MRSVGVGGRLLARDAHDALLRGLDALRLAPGSDAGVRVAPQVVGPRRPLRLAQLPVCGPRLVVDADYAARGPLRRHIDRVADRALTSHRTVTEWLANDLLVTGHPGVAFESAKAAPKRSNKPP